MSRPWDHNDDLRTALEGAGWRYAALIGIVSPDDAGCADTIEADRKAYADLIHTREGSPLWHCQEATSFVCGLTGATREVAAAWLVFDWHGGGAA